MTAALWFLVVGALLLAMGVTTGVIRRLPLTTAMIYFAVGYLMDPAGISFAALDPVRHPHVLERITEVAVLVSLFGAGLKLRAPFGGPSRDRRWVTPVQLATLSMLLTAALIAALAHYGLGLSLGAAVLLGGILAPTDPVLASDVQVAHPEDRDRLRFALTGEAGLNDGTAFPVVMLGLGLLGLHDLGPHGLRWLAVDVLWAGASGLAVGAVCGVLVGRVVLRLRATSRDLVGTDDMIALGLIGVSYGLALLVRGYGFLAVFVAALALRRAEERHAARAGDARPTAHVAADAEGVDDPLDAEADGGSAGDVLEVRAPNTPAIPSDEASGSASSDAPADAAPGATKAPALSQPYMVESALGATEQLERIGEAAVLLILGGLFTARHAVVGAWWFVAALFLVVRPLAVLVGAPATGESPVRRRLTMWFGIRGVGSVYYLTYAASHGLPAPLAEQLSALTLTVIVTSLVVHGVSVTPLMRRYRAWRRPGEARR